MITALWIVIGITGFLLLGALGTIGKLQKQVELLDREAHDQNKEIIDLMKFKTEATAMLLQHIDILKYLIDQDDTLGKKKIYYKGPIGEA